MFISPTAAADYNERFRDMYTFSELISNIRKVGKIESRKMQGQSAFRQLLKTSFRNNFSLFELVQLLQTMLVIFGLPFRFFFLEKIIYM